MARARSPVIERCVAVVTLYTLPRDRSSSRADVSRGGAPIGAGGSLFSSLLFSYASPRLSPLGVGSWPPTFRGKGGRGTKFGNNSYITYCSYHAFTLTSTLCRLYPGVWRITLSTIFRLAACRQRNNSNIAVQGNEDYLLTRVSFLFLGFKIVSRYQRIKCVYFKTLNNALIFWITTKLMLKTQRYQQKISASASVSYKSNKGIRLT